MRRRSSPLGNGRACSSDSTHAASEGEFRLEGVIRRTIGCLPVLHGQAGHRRVAQAFPWEAFTEPTIEMLSLPRLTSWH